MIVDLPLNGSLTTIISFIQHFWPVLSTFFIYDEEF